MNAIKHHMPAAEYHAADGISNSALKWFRKSPAHFNAMRRGLIKHEPSKAQGIGTILHSLLLEGRKDFIVCPETYGPDNKPWNRNATACKEWEATQTLPIISYKQAETIINAEIEIGENKFVRELLEGDVEVSLFAKCPRTGLRLKARADVVKPRCIVDLKTAAEADTRSFSRAIGKYRYQNQAAFYKYVAGLAGLDVSDFYFVALELEPLPMPNVFLVSEHDMEIATESLFRTLDDLAECYAENRWPGYFDGEPHLTNLPGWAHDLEEEVLNLNA